MINKTRKQRATTDAAFRFATCTTKLKGKDACHVFSSVAQNGYGVFKPAGKSVLAHRWIYEQTTGQPIPPGMVVMHECDNRACTRFSHLKLGTPAENAADMVAKGRSSKFADRKPRQPLTPEERALIIKSYKENKTIYAIAKATGRHYISVRGVVRNEAKTQAAKHAKVLSVLSGFVDSLSTLKELVAGVMPIGTLNAAYCRHYLGENFPASHNKDRNDSREL
jgi:hypothetical protein